jgi:hypothetical protein
MAALAFDGGDDVRERTASRVPEILTLLGFGSSDD